MVTLLGATFLVCWWRRKECTADRHASAASLTSTPSTLSHTAPWVQKGVARVRSSFQPLVPPFLALFPAMRSTLILLGAALASTPAALALLPKERPNLIPPGPKLPLRRSSAVLVDKRQLNETEPLEPTEGVTVTNTRSSATATRTGTATTGFATASTTRTGTATSTATASVSQGPCAVFYSASSSTLFSPAEARECMQ